MIIALLTDFGTKDYFVGAMKGVILSINEAAQIIDISHEIAPQNILSASFTLRACYKDFPKKTIFTTVVDPGVGSDRKALLVETEDYFFIAPDNGLLSFIFDGDEYFRVFEITNDYFFRKPVSKTFHGRDIFSPVAAHLANGVKPEDFGAEIKNYIYLKESKPQKTTDGIEAEIIHSDRFGNLITNLKQKDLPAKFSIEINGVEIIKFQTHFAAAAQNEVFMIIGSSGNLEIAAFRNSAAEILRVSMKQKFVLRTN